MENEKRKKGSHGVPVGYVDMKEMCQWFGRSPKSIRRMVETGSLPRPLKFGRQSLWDKKEIESWLKHAKFAKKARYG
jgi:predicted DNA-binding transcriptional regulator AlpA